MMKHRRRCVRTTAAGLVLAVSGLLARPALAEGSREVQPLGGTVMVHVESDRPADLLIEEPDPDGDAPRWSVVCAAPCDRDMPLAATYRLDGGGMRSTPPFRLSGRPGERVALALEPASTGAFVGATLLVTAGFISVGIGFVLSLVGTYDVNKPGQDSTTELVAGVSCFAGGAIASVTGVVLRGQNKRSAVRQSTNGGADATGQAPRPPAWAEAASSRATTTGTARTAVLPLWSGTF